MLNYEFRFDQGILVLKPEAPLKAADFAAVAWHIDTFLSRHGGLRGVMVDAREFTGWKDFGALLAHLRFVRPQHRQVEKVAVVSDTSAAPVMCYIADHFVDAKVEHFEPQREYAAWNWLTTRDRGAPLRRAA